MAAIFGGFLVFQLLRCCGRLLDRSPKLSLRADGLHDHRRNAVILWSDITEVNLRTIKIYGSKQRETLILKKDASPQGYVSIDVGDLDMDPGLVANLICQRIDVARRWQGT